MQSERYNFEMHNGAIVMISPKDQPDLRIDINDRVKSAAVPQVPKGTKGWVKSIAILGNDTGEDHVIFEIVFADSIWEPVATNYDQLDHSSIRQNNVFRVPIKKAS